MARILTISNLFPTMNRPQGAPFIDERIVQHRVAGHDIDRIDVRLSPSVLLRLAFEQTGRDPEDPLPTSGRFTNMSVAPREYVRMIKSDDRTEWAEEIAENIRGSLNMRRYDAIHAHGMYRVGAGLIALHLAKKLNVPFAVTIHGSDLNNGMHKRQDEFIRVLEAARTVMYVSPALRDRARSQGASSANGIITGNGVDLETFIPGPNLRSPQLLFVGNLASVKGADRLGPVFRTVHALRPDATFSVVGVGALEARIREDTRGLPVDFLGALPRTDVAARMRQAAILVVPSRSEGWPTVINEALASGTPVAATNVGGIAAALDGFPWTVDPDNEPEKLLGELAVNLMENPPDRSLLRQRAERYSWCRIASIERDALGIG